MSIEQKSIPFFNMRTTAHVEQVNKKKPESLLPLEIPIIWHAQFNINKDPLTI